MVPFVVTLDCEDRLISSLYTDLKVGKFGEVTIALNPPLPTTPPHPLFFAKLSAPHFQDAPYQNSIHQPAATHTPTRTGTGTGTESERDTLRSGFRGF